MRYTWLVPAVLASSFYLACGGGDSEFTPGDDDPSDDDSGASSSGSGPTLGGGDSGKPPPKNPDGGGVIDCDADPGACLPPGVCGDNQPGLGESCDDGNTTAGDGCSPTCQVEADYWACAFGVACVDVRDCAALVDAGLGGDGGCIAPEKAAVCGDGVRDPGEACDDHNVLGGDGCSQDCFAIEADYACPNVGQPCITTVHCGDGKIGGSEQCDDHNLDDDDGCTSSCQVTAGWDCPIPGTGCSAKECGDGKVAGAEQCDDGNDDAGDGCDATCRLETKVVTNAPTSSNGGSRVVTHYACSYVNAADTKQTCAPTHCGKNGADPATVDGNEQCDDGNLDPYDGCDTNCEIVPACKGGACKSKCGDGLLFDFDTTIDADLDPDEECDDGNQVPGDGCSADCKVEDGYKCTAQQEAPPAALDLPVVIRDFLFKDAAVPAGSGATNAQRHPDFENSAEVGQSGCTSKAQGTLDANFVPLRDAAGSAGCIVSDASFSDWYRDIQVGGAQRGRRIDGISLHLVLGADGYVFDSAKDLPYKSHDGYFPIDGKGYGNQGTTGAPNNTSHNFSFTTELRYAFTYDETKQPKLVFSGDDDVWVFINNQKVLDIGGIHGATEKPYTLTQANAQALGLVNGHVYEVALFNAERHVTQSNFKLTLSDFVKRRSVCANDCGDGIQTREEQCDLGAALNHSPAPYNGCSATCTLGDYCGDKTADAPNETCDDGVNQTSWTQAKSTTECGPSCQSPAYCGDGTIQGSYGERCDNGNANTSDADAYGNCTTLCKLGARCGDGTVQAAHGEVCDNGFNAASYVAKPGPTDCAPGCKAPRFCGDGNVDLPFEQCDRGSANTDDGSYGSCTGSCKYGPRCGDGVVQTGEQCDDGNRTNGDGCSAACNKENTGPH